jgi:hypothetical protein
MFSLLHSDRVDCYEDTARETVDLKCRLYICMEQFHPSTNEGLWNECLTTAGQSAESQLYPIMNWTAEKQYEDSKSSQTGADKSRPSPYP